MVSHLMLNLSALVIIASLTTASGQDCSSKEECDAGAFEEQPEDLEQVSLLQARTQSNSKVAQLQQKKLALEAELEAISANIQEIDASVQQLQCAPDWPPNSYGESNKYRKCTMGNDLHNGYVYVYNEGRHTSYSKCGSGCWCCVESGRPSYPTPYPTRPPYPTPFPTRYYPTPYPTKPNYNDDLYCGSGWPANANPGDSKREMCNGGNHLNNGYRYVYNEGRNGRNPKCGDSCWCCQAHIGRLACAPTFPPNQNTNDPLEKRCEIGNELHDGYWYVYNEGRNSYKNVCGNDCWCCRAHP